MTNFVQQLRLEGVTVKRDPMVEQGAEQTGKDSLGCFLIEDAPDNPQQLLALHEDLDDHEVQAVAKWALLRKRRLEELGRHHDGWQVRSDGHLQLWINAYEIDPWLTDRS